MNPGLTKLTFICASAKLNIMNHKFYVEMHWMQHVWHHKIYKWN